MIIGVTGFFAAGKDTVAACLQRRGFMHVSLSDILRDEMRRRGIAINIPNLTQTGNQLRREQGAGVLGRLAAQKLAGEGDAVVSSIRHPDEVQALRETAPDFIMIFVNAPRRVRFERSQRRKRDGDAKTFEEFCRQEDQQLRSEDGDAQQLRSCRELADFELVNDGSSRELENKIEIFLNEIRANSSDKENF